MLSANQPYFSPFPGFFSKAALSDVFVILDEVQFPRGTTWITRNRFKSDKGTLWITVPVWKKGLGLQRIDEVRICHERPWAKKHLASLKNAYAHAPYFRDHLAFLEGVFSEKFERLVDLNLSIIRHLMQALGIETKMLLLSDLGIAATGTQRLVEICRKLGSSRYLAQAAAGKYLDEKLFQEAGIEVTFFAPPSIIYPQLWADYIGNLSAFDLLFNCGPKAHDLLLGR
ncbi:MAG: WbqC family protein [Proteobacteria bacterium]|nr:WbqC family protein [Pseudomonadota bacterium]